MPGTEPEDGHLPDRGRPPRAVRDSQEESHLRMRGGFGRGGTPPPVTLPRDDIPLLHFSHGDIYSTMMVRRNPSPHLIQVNST